MALSFDSEAFVTWLNDNVLSDSIEKVAFEEKDIQLVLSARWGYTLPYKVVLRNHSKNIYK